VDINPYELRRKVINLNPCRAAAVDISDVNRWGLRVMAR
jgi:hypothetical protein